MGDLWEEIVELLLGTIVIKYKDHCERECGPLLSPESSDPNVINSSGSSVTSNSPSLLLVFSDPSVTNSSESRFTGNSQPSVITTSQLSIAVSN